MIDLITSTDLDELPLRVVLVLITLLFIYNIYVSVRVFKSRYYVSKQKVWQTVIVWLFPLLGVIFVHYMVFDTERVEKAKGGKKGIDKNRKDDDIDWRDPHGAA